MHNKQHSTTLWMVVALLGCGLALIALAGQVVSAQPLVNELKPPFGFAELPMAPEAQTPPPGSTVLLTENFGTSFNPTTSLTGSTPLWRKFVNPSDTAGYYWNKVSAGAFSNSAWSAAEPITSAPMLTPGVSNYPAGQDTWLIYGPIDLSRFVYGHVSFEYYLDSQAGDTLLWGYSTDGQTFYGNSQSGPLSKWITDTFSFRASSTFQTVYLGFAFNSHAGPQGKGPFVRNVRVTGEPLKFGYVPLVMSNYAAPTPTPIPPLYGYTFDPGNNDITVWGTEYSGYTTGFGGPCWYGQGIRTNHGNPINSLYVGNACKFAATYASPNVNAPTNFEMIVDISPWRLYGEELFGVIFNASDNTFGRDQSGQATFNTRGNYYRLSLATNVGDDLVTSILLERCLGGSCTALTPGYAGLQPLPANLVYGQSAYWDQVRVLRVGNNIKVFVNNVQLIDMNDGTLIGSGKFGVHIFPLEGNVTADPPYGAQMQIDFDNIRIYSR